MILFIFLPPEEYTKHVFPFGEKIFFLFVWHEKLHTNFKCRFFDEKNDDETINDDEKKSRWRKK